MRNQHPITLKTVCFLFTIPLLMVFLFAASAPAEMYIHLNSGEIVTLPYSRADVKKITYGGPGISASSVTLMSHNYPNLAIRHRNFLGEISEISSELDQLDTTFRVVKGLADSSAISFESVNYPGYYLRHQNYRIKLHKNDGSRLFLEDATFRGVPGLADGSKYSFESFNYPNHYIRHKNFMLYIDQGNDDLFRNDVTFTMGPPAWSR